MNWFVLIPFGIAVIALIVFLVMRNQKDEEQFEQQLKDDYHKTHHPDGDPAIDEVLK